MKLIAVAALALALTACQQRASSTIHDARVVVTGSGAAIYATIDDKGGGDRLMGIELDGIGRASLHDMRIENGVMRMREVPGGFPVPGGGSLALAPMGKHAMIEAMATPPKPGTSIPVTFVFARQLRLHATARVESGTGMAM